MSQILIRYIREAFCLRKGIGVTNGPILIWRTLGVYRQQYVGHFMEPGWLGVRDQVFDLDQYCICPLRFAFAFAAPAFAAPRAEQIRHPLASHALRTHTLAPMILPSPLPFTAFHTYSSPRPHTLSSIFPFTIPYHAHPSPRFFILEPWLWKLWSLNRLV